MACQSQPNGASCASSLPMTPPASLPSFADGQPPLIISDAVVEKVGVMIAEENDPNLRLRIFVTGGGCSGFQYGFAFDDAPKEDDLEVTRGTLRVVVDAMSLQYLTGAEIDYEEGLEGSRFVIRNPNATTTCGCGSSFNV